MTAPRILVATDRASDGQMVKDMLRGEFEQVLVSTVADQAANDFENHQPDVLILAFNTLAKAEQHYTGLSRLCKRLHTQPHRTLVLCDKSELHQAYAQCRDERFDDYVLFWPLIHDAPRLAMSVMRAWRDLLRARSAAVAVDMARQVRRMVEVERDLTDQLGQGRTHAEAANRSLDGIILDIDALKPRDVGLRLRALKAEVQPFQQWLEDMNHRLEPHAACATTLSEMAERFQPVVLIVDDNAFERKLVGQLLEEALYDLVFAESGSEALAVMCDVRPDLILLDMDMPGINGLETLDRLKVNPDLCSIPVMMITGHSGKDVVVKCLKAGAVDFSVKPLDREGFLRKVAKVLAMQAQ